MTQRDSDRDPRIYMAAERTFLAWIRTGLALMAFGFVVARVSALVNLGSSPASPSGAAAPTSAASLWLGLALIAAGIVTCVLAAVKNERYVHAIDAGQFRAAFGSALGVGIVAMLALIGGAMLVYLAAL
jgi:putative membrane protein